ncbi:MAG: hypothetical protein K8L99_12345 [Anaerolineae bacterium]|nr:hypothetical protein [Anaerolineae bacterium]
MAILSQQNPVLRAELKHQQYVMNNSRSGPLWIGIALVMLVPAMLYSLVLLYFALTGLNPLGLLDIRTFGPGNGASNMALYLIVMNFAMYVVVSLITMGLASGSITREQQNHTWESLLLTSMNARQIVWGKWWATLRALWGDQIMIMLLRAGLVAFAAVQVTRFVHGGQHPDLLYLLLSLALVVAYTAVEAGFSAAVGLITPFIGWDGMFIAALMVRVLAVVVVPMVIVILSTMLADTVGGVLIAALAGLILSGLLLLATLHTAEWMAVRQQALRPDSP